MPDPSPSLAAPSAAATLLLVRDDPAFQVLMVERHRDNPFGPGALVFPGGKLDPQDHAADWGEVARGWADLDPETRALRLCAVRETFEETAVLLARTEAAGVRDAAAPTMTQAREQACRGDLRFRDVVDLFSLHLDLHALTPFARWITPELSPIRFDATFFVAAAPPDQIAACDGFETVNAEWIEPGRALRLAELGERKLMLPTRMSLKRLDEHRSVAATIQAARARPVSTITPSRGALPADALR